MSSEDLVAGNNPEIDNVPDIDSPDTPEEPVAETPTLAPIVRDMFTPLPETYPPNMVIPNSTLTNETRGDYLRAVVKKIDAMVEAGTLKDVDAEAILKPIGEIFNGIGHITFSDGRFTGNIPPGVTPTWANGVDTPNGVRLGTTPIGIAFSKGDNRVLAGESAVALLTSRMKAAQPVKIFCWNSGIRLNVSRFTERAMDTLLTVLENAKNDIGLYTYGSTFSGDDYYMTGVILDEIFRHVTGANIDIADMRKIGDYISVHDIGGILTGMLANIYPGGYPVFHQCINAKCNVTIEAFIQNGPEDIRPSDMVNFLSLTKVDSSRLTPEDVLTLSSSEPQPVKNLQDYRARQDARIRSTTKPFVVKNGAFSVEVFFRVPSISEYIEGSKRWVIECNRMVEEVMATGNMRSTSPDTVDDVRASILRERTSAASIEKDMPWVSHLRILEDDGEEYMMHDRKSISETLTSWSAGVVGLENDLFVALQEFKEISSITITGFNNYTCPSCGEPQHEKGHGKPYIIPINVVSYFFTHLVLRSVVRQLTIQGA